MNNIESVLPIEFIKEMKELLNVKEYNMFIDSFNKQSEKGIRVNTQKISVEKFLKLNDSMPLEKIPYLDNGFYCKEDKIGSTIFHQIGALYSQEPSSMVPVSCLQHLDLKGKKVLDLCAAPGGKSTQIAQLIGEEGLLVSNEVVTSRAKILFSNIERLGLTNVIVTNEKIENLSKHFQGFFDVVIVDAPCSGEGMFRKDSSAIREWRSESVVSNSIRQQKILSYAKMCVKNQGYLLYSTCTYNKCENENNVEFLIKNGFQLVDVFDKVKPYVKYGMFMDKTVRCFPFFTRGEGQFCAVLKNENQVEESLKINKKIEHENNKLANEFLNKYFNFPFEVEIETINNKIHIVPKNNVYTGNLNVLSKGVILGEIVKNRIEPHHQLFSAYGKYCKIKVEYSLNDEKVKKYLKGEQLYENVNDGFGVILCEGCSVGGFKSVNGDLKNYYPKGLRIALK